MAIKGYTNRQTSLFVQTQPGFPTQFLGTCFNMDSFPTSLPGRDPIICLNTKGDLSVIATSQTPPDLPTFSLEHLMFDAISYLKTLHCPFTLFAHHKCGKGQMGVFGNWERGESMANIEIVGGDTTNVANRETDGPILVGTELSGFPPRYDYARLSNSQVAFTPALDEDAVSIDGCVFRQCSEDCGERTQPGDTIVIGLEDDGADSLILVGTKNIYGVQTWAASAQGAFANPLIMSSAKCVQVGVNTTRVIATRSTAVAAMTIAYTDDLGATAWTTVAAVGGANEGVINGQGLFILDEEHIWLCTDIGNVYFSSNAGVTWAVQPSALAAAGAVNLNCIHFVDEDIGFCAGAAGVVIGTIDGGVNWTTLGVPSGDDILSIVAHSQYRVSIGTDEANQYMAFDGGVVAGSWNLLNNFTGAADTGELTSMKFIDDLNGFMTHTLTGGAGWILQTINGGFSWERVGAVTGSAGLNDIWIQDLYNVYAVGDDDGTNSMILTASAAASALSP